MGVIFAFVIEATDSILATMIMHFIINGSSVLSLVLQKAMSGFTDTAALTDYAGTVSTVFIIRSIAPTAILSAVFAFFVYRAIARNSGRWEHISGLWRKGSDTRFLTPGLILGIVICLILMFIKEY